MIIETEGNTINTELIYDYMARNNLSKSKFCALCKISPLTLKKILSGSIDFGTVSLFKISSILGVRIHQMFK